MSSEISLVDPHSATAAPPAANTPWIGTEPLVREGLHASFRASAWFPQGGATSRARDERAEKHVPNDKVVFNRFKSSLRDGAEQGDEQRSSSTGGRRPLSAMTSNASRSGSALMRRPPSAKKQSARPEWNCQAFTGDVGRLHVSQRDKAMKASRAAGDFGSV